MLLMCNSVAGIKLVKFLGSLLLLMKLFDTKTVDFGNFSQELPFWERKPFQNMSRCLRAEKLFSRAHLKLAV